MTVHYFDPSAWIKRHFHEAGTDVISNLFRTVEVAACCRLGLVEMIATVSRKSFAESLDVTVTEQLLRNIKSDFGAFEVLPVDEQLIAIATDLAMRHRLRTMDAIHLAAALTCRQLTDAVIVVSSDSGLIAAAKQEGLATLDPVGQTT